MQTERELREAVRVESLAVERLYWVKLRDEAQSRGETGESFTRCIDSIDRELSEGGEGR